MTVILFPGYSIPDDPFDDVCQETPEPIHYGDDELSPEEFEEALEDQAIMQRIMDGLEELGFMTATIRLDSLPMALVPDSELGLD